LNREWHYTHQDALQLASLAPAGKSQTPVAVLVNARTADGTTRIRLLCSLPALPLQEKVKHQQQ
jgi:hypothetical protein